MPLFWKRGFEGTSMADLTQAMDLNPSSIYAAFGDMHALFSLAVKRYLSSRDGMEEAIDSIQAAG
jgi:AcrR family transcriptional regulator